MKKNKDELLRFTDFGSADIDILGKLGVLTAVMHLAPGDISGHEVCPNRSPGCTAACLHFAGSPAYMATKTKARIARTQLLFRDRNLFMNILVLEVAKHLKLAGKRNMTSAFRLNGTSDICWEAKKFVLFPEVAEQLSLPLGVTTIDKLFSDAQFYDYTAIPNRKVGANYHLTFSMKENNLADTLAAIAAGLNVAVVFAGKRPSMLLKLPVIDGDDHDYRPADPDGCIVGLRAKGARGRQDLSGFVTDSVPALIAA